ncbi:uncharacterized protein LOC127291458 [Leptopilina boulardi]|uniref:uncharacterized protein LOC127291458 n=1 Tax=Leptopilina boulardi TaxID=63433 RepID=UPI0021F58DAD|nr:uncharacterized protein LOC127291458 [Leptopilina boulardi]
MKGRIYESRTGLCLLALFVSFLIDYHPVIAKPEPASFDIEDTEELVLLQRLRTIVRHKQEVIDQEKELTEEQIAIQAILDDKARNQKDHQTMLEEFSMEDTETLPVPSAIFNPPQHNGKRTYMTLCHFKICNMGRKRQI